MFAQKESIESIVWRVRRAQESMEFCGTMLEEIEPSELPGVVVSLQKEQARCKQELLDLERNLKERRYF
jgi:hypothetical protein